MSILEKNPDDSDYYSALGQRIKSLRGKGKQKEIADILGVSQSTMSKIEKGEQKLTALDLFKIIKSYDVSLAWLLTGEPDKMDDTETRKFHGDLDFVIQNGDMVQRGAVKGIIQEYALEVREDLRIREVKKGRRG